jgi:PIN domain nuclease of toxin-antitoxin system
VRLLLDTCALLWYLDGSERIQPALRDVLTDGRNDLYSSDVSLLEMVIKYQLGKLPLPAPPSQLIPALRDRHGIEALALDAAAILALEHLPLLHRDPFDRLLVAQAVTRQLTLVTPDPMIRQYDVPCLWNP